MVKAYRTEMPPLVKDGLWFETKIVLYHEMCVNVEAPMSTSLEWNAE